MESALLVASDSSGTVVPMKMTVIHSHLTGGFLMHTLLSSIVLC